MALERFFRRRKAQGEARDIPTLWIKCPNCDAALYRPDLEANHYVCSKCDHHLRMPVTARVALIADRGSFEQTTGQVKPADPLEFTDTETYPARLARYQKDTGRPDAILGGRCTIGGRPSVLLCMDYAFAGGSMGSVVGEEIARGAELAAREGRALVVVAASGGARMQESVLSLMQMAKTTLALERLWAQRQPYISILSDPTTGGVTASFAAIADVILAEPKALIGFAGPRVIKQTIRQDLPEGFQRSEFHHKHGMVDMVVPRKELAGRLALLLSLLGSPQPAA